MFRFQSQRALYLCLFWSSNSKWKQKLKIDKTIIVEHSKKFNYFIENSVSSGQAFCVFPTAEKSKASGNEKNSTKITTNCGWLRESQKHEELRKMEGKTVMAGGQMKSEMRRELKATVAATFVVRFSRWLRSPFARSACHFPRWKILVSPPTRLAFPQICYDHRAAPSFFFAGIIKF